MYRLVLVSVIATLVPSCATGVVRVPPALPIDVQLKVSQLPRIWVAGFVTNTGPEFDVNVETVRLLRGRLRELSPAVVEGQPLAINDEQRLADVSYWRTQGEERGSPLIVTGSVKFLLAPPAIEQRGRGMYVPTAGRVLEATVMLIDGRTGMVLSEQRLPARMRYGIGRFSSGLSLYFQLMDRAMPDWLSAIAVATKQ